MKKSAEKPLVEKFPQGVLNNKENKKIEIMSPQKKKKVVMPQQKPSLKNCPKQ